MIVDPRIPDSSVESICSKLAAGGRVRRRLPFGARIHIDRQLPFLCLYRHPGPDPDWGTDRLVTSEGAYLIATRDRRSQAKVTELVEQLARVMGASFGAYLVLELWARSESVGGQDGSDDPEFRRPGFRVLISKQHDPGRLIDRFDAALSRIRIGQLAAEVQLSRTPRPCPPGVQPVLSARRAEELHCLLVGLEVRPIYRAADGEDGYPLVLRELRRKLTRAMRRFFYNFTRRHTTHRPEHYHVLGRRAVVKAVWEVDEKLAAVSSEFDFLLQATPTNAVSAWQQFQRSKFDEAPVFHYRPLASDPLILKRRLFSTPVERIEDPALAEIFQKKLEELDRQISLLHDIDSPRFLPGSIQLYGGVEPELVDLAHEMIRRIPPRSRDDRGETLDADAFTKLAQKEIEYYRRQLPEMDGSVEIRDDIASNLMVSGGKLLISSGARIPGVRAEALIQHEVGTHMLTYYNGRAQPFRQLYTGLAGYESLQEGLAVLAEYFVGGLSRPRLRLLSARVVSIAALIDGATFVEAFRLLHGTHGVPRRSAFTVVMRTYRSGGLTKDAAYLRGLGEVLHYLGKGGAIEPLFVGKIAAEHIPIIRELEWRGVLNPVPLRPRYQEQPGFEARLERLRRGITVLDLFDQRPHSREEAL